MTASTPSILFIQEIDPMTLLKCNPLVTPHKRVTHIIISHNHSQNINQQPWKVSNFWVKFSTWQQVYEDYSFVSQV